MLVQRTLITVLIVVAFLGFLDASYLTASHYANVALPCYIVQGCDIVTTSVYSKIFGIPVSLLGVGFYLSLLILTMYYIDKRKDSVIIFALPLVTSLGFLASLWFMYAQLFLLKALCAYCIFSAVTSTTLFIISIIMRATLKKRLLTNDSASLL